MTPHRRDTWAALAVIAVVGLTALYVALDFKAYRERFPNAPAWTYLFQ